MLHARIMRQQSLTCWLLLGAALLLGGCASTPDPMEAQPAREVDVAAEGGVHLEPLWTRDVGGAGGINHGLELALAGGRLYAANAGGVLMALDPESGEQLWAAELNRPLSGGPAAGGGLVAIGTREGEVLGVDAENGELLWVSGVTSEVLAPPAVGQGVVVARTNDGRVFTLDSATGERRWLYDRNVPSLSLRGHGSPVLVPDGVIVGFDNGRLTALTLSDGAPVWEATIGVPSGRTDLDRMVDVDADPVVSGDDVYAASYQGRVAALTVDGGRIQWAREVSAFSGLAVDESNVYVADAQGRLWALDRYNGASVWRQDAFEGQLLGDPSVADGLVFVGGSDGYLNVISTSDGRILARTEIDDTRIVAPPLIDGDRLYVLSVGGELAAFRIER